MKREEVSTLTDLLIFCEEQADNIVVREQVDGKWGAYSLTDMPRELRCKAIARWIEEGAVPIALPSDAGDEA